MQDISEKHYNQCVLALQKLINKLKPSTSTSERSMIVAMYTTDDDNPLRFSGKIGMLQLDFDRKFKTRFFRFYDLQTLDLLMELELFYGFGDNYRKFKKQTLYVFDFFHNGSIGFEFRNKQDAEKMLIKVKAASPKMQEFRQLQKNNIKKQMQQRQSKTFFGKMKKKWHEFRGDQVPEKQQSKIIQVQKKRSIAFNFQSGEFDLQNIPIQWQEIFDAIGLNQKQLKDRKIMGYIFQEALIHQAKKAAEEAPENISKRQMTLISQDNCQQFRESDISSLKSSVMTCDFEKTQECQPPQSDLPNLPPPPDISNLTIPPLLSPPPTLGPPPQIKINRVSKQKKQQKTTISRADLMDEIRNNKIKLKPVNTSQKKIQIDASAMNKEERKDLAEHIRLKLQKRKIALSRRQASSDSSSRDE